MTGHNKVGNGDLYTVNAAVLPRLSFDSLRRISTSYFHPTFAITMAKRVEEPPQPSFHQLIATAVNTAKKLHTPDIVEISRTSSNLATFSKYQMHMQYLI